MFIYDASAQLSPGGHTFFRDVIMCTTKNSVISTAAHRRAQPAWSVFHRLQPIADSTTLIATRFVTFQKALGVSSNNSSPSNPQR